MARLTEETVISQVSIDEYGNVSVRRSTRVYRDDELVAETYHRHVIDKDKADDPTEHPRVRALVKAAREAPAAK